MKGGRVGGVEAEGAESERENQRGPIYTEEAGRGGLPPTRHNNTYTQQHKTKLQATLVHKISLVAISGPKKVSISRTQPFQCS
jgi:hypothetical protein